jgi:O-succinylbenzoic acid--CoA ligase
MLRPVIGPEIDSALAAALAGGDPVAPLPPAGVEQVRALEVLQPRVRVTEPDTGAVIATSGSTGAPKAVVLSRRAIRASVAATHHRLGGPGDWALALPTHYVAGFMVLARSALTGRTTLRVRSDLGDLASALGQLVEPRYLSIVPTQLVRGLRVPDVAAALAGFDTVLLGGGACDPELLSRARDAQISTVTTYGMAETCGGCVYDGRPLSGVRVDIIDGQIRIGGDTLFSGYRLQPDRTAATLTDHGFETADRGRWVGDRLVVDGRLDDVVISGGANVDLAEVERHVRAWAVTFGADAVVVGVADPDWGSRVVAVSDAAGSLIELRARIRKTLPEYAAPRELVRLDPLPRLLSGKPDRQAILALVSGGRPPRQTLPQGTP